MAKQKSVCFDNEIIKQGNSYCVRIPKGAMEYMDFELGDTVLVTLERLKEEKIPKSLLDIYRKNIKELKDFSDKELNSCFFNFNVETRAMKDLKKDEKERISKAFEKTVELGKSKNFLKKYRIFKKSLTKKNVFKITKALKESKFKELGKIIDIELKNRKKSS